MLTLSRYPSNDEARGHQCGFYVGDDFIKFLYQEEHGAWFLVDADKTHVLIVNGRERFAGNPNGGDTRRYRIAMRPGDEAHLGDVTIQLLRFEGRRALIGIEAPASVRVAREEIAHLPPKGTWEPPAAEECDE